MGTKDDYTTHGEAQDALYALQRYARDLGVSLESVMHSLVREQLVNTTMKEHPNAGLVKILVGS
jgi:hypothetical protein